MALLSNGIARRKAATVLGANCSSKRAWNVKSPARTINWLIRDTRDARGRISLKGLDGCHKLLTARNNPANCLILRLFAALGKGGSEAGFRDKPAPCAEIRSRWRDGFLLPRSRVTA